MALGRLISQQWDNYEPFYQYHVDEIQHVFFRRRPSDGRLEFRPMDTPWNWDWAPVPEEALHLVPAF